MKFRKDIIPILYTKLYPAIFILLLLGCKNKPEQNQVSGSELSITNPFFRVENFVPVTNIERQPQNAASDSDRVVWKLPLDYTDAIDGFTIPSVRQAKNGLFEFAFTLKNLTKNPAIYYYKIYYQNESYKFPEKDSKNGGYNELAEENFYGSWTDVNIGFIPTETVDGGNEITIKNHFRIQGNPRDDSLYFENGVNHRWKRNPRVGNYSFLLVVCNKEDLEKIPDYIKFVHKKKDGRYVNPYYYFLYGDGKKLQGTIAIRSKDLLNVKANPDITANGIYAQPEFFGASEQNANFTQDCNCNENTRKNAVFQHFIHYIDPATTFHNIPVIADLDEYSTLDYYWNKNFYRKDELIAKTSESVKIPCRSVKIDKQSKSIRLINLPSEYGNWGKRNAGIITRHGLTYGKYTVKVKLTRLLNKYNVWKGITNAIWLITQGDYYWNQTRRCSKSGYLSNYYGGNTDKRVQRTSYTEIDFEILKTVPYCPSYQFPPVYNHTEPNQNNFNQWYTTLPDELKEHESDIIVACTNWDMACPQPEKFSAGCSPITYKGKTFESHRWDTLYRAVTQKSWQSDEELFGQPYYFQIEWKPDEIIWRIGKELSNLKVVGYMNSTMTSIPSNQMLLIISQEYHNTKWWPISPFSQDNIPFPAKELTGDVFELIIE